MKIKECKIRVLGANSLLGHNIIKRLKHLGYTKVSATYHNKYPIEPVDEVVYFKANLLNPSHCKVAVEGSDCVIMAAANTSGTSVIESNPLVHVTPNIVMNAQILEAAYKAGVKKFLFFSSTCVYPPSEFPMEEEQLMQGDPFDKYYAVGWMKRYTEVLCKMYSTKLNPSMPCVVFRLANVYGPNDRFDYKTSHVLPVLIRRIVEKKNPLELWSDGTELRDFLYVDDVANAVISALEKVNAYDVFNIGCGNTVSIREVIPMIMKAANFYPEVKYSNSAPSMIPVRRINITKAKTILGFESKIKLEDGIRYTVNWLKYNLKSINK